MRYKFIPVPLAVGGFFARVKKLAPWPWVAVAESVIPV